MADTTTAPSGRGITALTFKFKALAKAAGDAAENVQKTKTAARAAAPDPDAENVEKLRHMGSVGGLGPSLGAVLDNLEKLIRLQHEGMQNGAASAHDLFELMKYIGLNTEFIKTWGGAEGQRFNFDAFERRILSGAGKEAEKAVTRVIEKEKRSARGGIGTGGFGFGGAMPTKPVDTLAQQVSQGQLRG